VIVSDEYRQARRQLVEAACTIGGIAEDAGTIAARSVVWHLEELMLAIDLWHDELRRGDGAGREER